MSIEVGASRMKWRAMVGGSVRRVVEGRGNVERR